MRAGMYCRDHGTERKTLMKEWLVNNFTFLATQLADISFTDILDILLVSVALFYAYRFIRERRAGKLALGFVVLLVILILSDILQMHIIRYVLENVFQVGLLMVMILFQPELRSVLEKVGSEPIKSLRMPIQSLTREKIDNRETIDMIREVTSAIGDLSDERTGALLVFKRSTPLGDIMKSGTEYDAEVCAQLIKNIFFNKAPMHDGATVIANNRICASGCFLPLSLNEDIIKDLGTRHRAGIGISENSDAVVVIVSEETGMISVAIEGDMRRGFTRETLAKELEKQLITVNQENIYSKLRNRKTDAKQEGEETPEYIQMSDEEFWSTDSTAASYRTKAGTENGTSANEEKKQNSGKNKQKSAGRGGKG